MSIEYKNEAYEDFSVYTVSSKLFGLGESYVITFELVIPFKTADMTQIMGFNVVWDILESFTKVKKLSFKYSFIYEGTSAEVNEGLVQTKVDKHKKNAETFWVPSSWFRSVATNRHSVKILKLTEI